VAKAIKNRHFRRDFGPNDLWGSTRDLCHNPVS